MTNPEESLEYLLGRIEQKIDNFVETQKRHDGVHEKLDKRLCDLEAWRTGVVAKATGASFILGVVGTAAWRVLEHYLSR